MDTASSATLALGRLGDPAVCDIEGGVEKDEDDGSEVSRLLCVGFRDASGTCLVVGKNACESASVRAAILAALRARRVIGQNWKFDGSVLQGIDGEPVPAWFDTMLSSYVCDERTGIHSLEYNSLEYTGAPDYKHMTDQYAGKGKNKNFAKVPEDVLYKYNGYDVEVTWQLYEYFSERMERDNLRGLHDFLVEVSNLLTQVELRGIKVDLDYNEDIGEDILEKMDELEGKFGSVNPRSPKQIHGHFASYSLALKNTAASTLEAIQDDSRLPSDLKTFVKSLLEHRKLAKLHGTYVKGVRQLVKTDGRVHSSFGIHTTTTGRTSSRRPNVQNLPRVGGIKEQFVPEDGYIFVRADFGQIELRVLTWLAQDEYMRELFNDQSRDVFTELSKSLFSPTKGRPTYESLTDKEKSELRVQIKSFAYGLSYGREAGSIAHEFGISFKEAKKKMDDFYSMIPTIMEFQESIKKKIKNHEHLISPFGRHRRFPLITPENRRDIEREAMAFLPQGTASDICLLAAIELEKNSVPIVNLVHDEITAEVPIDEAEDVGSTMSKVMVKTGEDFVDGYVAFKADAEYGRSLAK